MGLVAASPLDSPGRRDRLPTGQSYDMNDGPNDRDGEDWKPPRPCRCRFWWLGRAAALVAVEEQAVDGDAGLGSGWALVATIDGEPEHLGAMANRLLRGFIPIALAVAVLI